jgi:hypothetical protein
MIRKVSKLVVFWKEEGSDIQHTTTSDFYPSIFIEDDDTMQLFPAAPRVVSQGGRR